MGILITMMTTQKTQTESGTMRVITVYQGLAKIEIENDGVSAKRYLRDDDGQGGYTPWRMDAEMTMTPDQIARLDALEAEQENQPKIHMGSM